MTKLREFRYRLFSWRRYPKLVPSPEPIDVVIPIIAKDLVTLPLCLEGVRHCVSHTIKDIYIVAPDDKDIREMCDRENLRFVDELQVFGFSPRELKIHIKDANGNIVGDRSGWLFQQFVKLSGKIGTCRYYLCIDADHVLIRPHVFLTEDNTQVFYLSYEEHQPYYDNIHRLLPELELTNLSYVDHKMLFDKEKLTELKDRISANSGGKPWMEAIMDSLDRTVPSGFSEFETYGNFVGEKILRPWMQKRLPYNKMSDYDTLCRKYKGGRWSLTFPNYMKQNKKN